MTTMTKKPSEWIRDDFNKRLSWEEGGDYLDRVRHWISAIMSYLDEQHEKCTCKEKE